MVDLNPGSIGAINTTVNNISGGIYNEQFWLPANDVPAAAWVSFQAITGNQANKWGDWIEIASAAAFPADRLVINKIFPTDIDVSPYADDLYELEIGIGALGFEVPLTRTRFLFDNSIPLIPWMAVDLICPIIPPGTRIVARVKRTGSSPETVFFNVGYLKI